MMNIPIGYVDVKPKTSEKAHICPKCGGTGFWCLYVENGVARSNTGTACWKCNGTGWVEPRTRTRRSQAATPNDEAVRENEQRIAESVARREKRLRLFTEIDWVNAPSLNALGDWVFTIESEDGAYTEEYISRGSFGSASANVKGICTAETGKRGKNTSYRVTVRTQN